MKTRVVIVDPHTSVREMLAVLIAQEAGFEIVGDAGTGIEGLRLCENESPSLVILELALPELCGIELLRRLRWKRQCVRTLIYSGVSAEMQIKALRIQPDGFVAKSDSLKTLREAIRMTATGGVYISMSLCRVRRLIRSQGESVLALTDREREILQMVAESRSSKEIAARLTLCPKTVENHRMNIMRKLDLHDIAALTRFAMREGVVQ